MKFVKASYRILDQPLSYEEACKHAEYAGRTCYHSVDKITDDSYESFIDNLIKHHHNSPLEHCTIYLVLPIYKVLFYIFNKYSKVRIRNGVAFVTTNLRVLVENNRLKHLSYWSSPSQYHEKRVTVHFTCSRQILAEYTRHRAFSFAAESTRFCNYSKDKFGKELTFIEPCWKYFSVKKDRRDGDEIDCCYEDHLYSVEKTYFKLLDRGWKPEQAAAILPNGLKTELIMTGFVSDWKHFFNLRSSIAKTGTPHPQSIELADPLMKEFKDLSYV